MGTHVAVHAPEFGGLPPDLPSTIGRERASPRTSYNVWERHDEDGTSTGRFDFCHCVDVGGPRFTSGPGEYISFLSFELLKYRLYCSNFI
jgi:hypothetical protein